MLRLLGFLRRRPDLTLAAFSAHWSTVHRELALRLVAPGIMRGYAQNHRLEAQLPEARAAADGCPEMCVENLAAVARLGSAPEYLEGAYVDEPNFMEVRASVSVLRTTLETLASAAPRSATKLMCFFNPADMVGRDVQDPRPWWLPDAQPVRLERATCLSEIDLGTAGAPWAGVESSWWPDLEAVYSAWRARRGRVATRDAMLVRELRVLEPAPS